MDRREKLRFGLGLKDQANELYHAGGFAEAAKLYGDCLVALDLGGIPEERLEVQTKLQLPVCTNLAACMIEMANYLRCIEICNVALSVDAHSCKALFRRGLARYRLGDHHAARADFEAALASLPSAQAAAAARRRGPGEAKDTEGATPEEEKRGLDDLERRVHVYLGHIRRFSQQERMACKKMFEEKGSLYAEKPGAKEEAEDEDEPFEVDDSDEAIDAALARARGDWNLRCCRRRQEAKAKSA